MSSRYGDWLGRIAFRDETAQLGFYAETWTADLTAHPSHASLVEQGAKGDTILRQLTRGLVMSVVYAACGAEHALANTEAAAAAAQAWAASEIELPEDEEWPQLGISHPALFDATWELTNFLWWTRAVEERIDRAPPPRSPSGTPRLGLMPWLNPDREARSQVGRLLEAYRQNVLADTRAPADQSRNAQRLRRGADTEQALRASGYRSPMRRFWDRLTRKRHEVRG